MGVCALVSDGARGLTCLLGCCACSAAMRARAEAGALVVHQGQRALVPTASGEKKEYVPSAQLAKRLPSAWPRPVWHAPWKRYRVCSGHLGRVALLRLGLAACLAWHAWPPAGSRRGC